MMQILICATAHNMKEKVHVISSKDGSVNHVTLSMKQIKRLGDFQSIVQEKIHESLCLGCRCKTLFVSAQRLTKPQIRMLLLHSELG